VISEKEEYYLANQNRRILKTGKNYNKNFVN
jgi:hypothetical protein